MIRLKGSIIALLTALATFGLAIFALFNIKPVLAETDAVAISEEAVEEETDAEESVQTEKAKNYWDKTPYVVSHTYGDYNAAKHLVKGEPHSGNADDVTYTLYKADEFEHPYEALTGGIGGIANLNTGKYVLVCALEEGDDYEGLSYNCPFTVEKAGNYWDVSPMIANWTYGQYNKEYNIASAVPHKGNAADVTYYYYPAGADGQIIDKDNYYININDMADKDGNIPAGKYVLKAVLEETANHKGLEGYHVFEVYKAVNSWITTPNVVRWHWGEYSPYVNVISAEPAHGTVQYRIYTLEGGADDTEAKFNVLTYDNYAGLKQLDGTMDTSAFELDEDGFVPGAVSDKLAKLDAGTYYLLATVVSSADYYGINNQKTEGLGGEITPMRFTIQKADNSWAEAPYIIGWSENNYDEDKNALVASTKFGTDLEVTIYDEKDNEYTLDDLKNLKIGNYTAYIFSEGTDNYSSIDATISFTVTEEAVGVTGLIAATLTFAGIAVCLAVAAIVLLILKRRKAEEELREFIKSEMNGGKN